MKNIFLGLILIVSCTPREKVKEGIVRELPAGDVILSDEQYKSAGISYGKVEMRQISGAIKVNGVLDVPPQNLVTISAPMSGFVKSTDLLQGMRVAKGQAIVTLEDPGYIQLQQDYLESKSQVDFLQLEYQRQEELSRENVNAAKVLQQAKSNYFAAKAHIAGLLAKLKFINIDVADLEKGVISSFIVLYSPISGYVTEVNVNIGMHVNAADVMFRIMDNSHVHAEAQVFEKDVTKLKIGQRVRITLSNDSKEREAKVYLIGKEITAERTVRVHCHLEDEDPSLIPGMYFSGIIETKNESVHALPESAIVNFDAKNYIFVAADTTTREFRLTEIKKGNVEEGYAAVGLPKDFGMQTPVVIRGAFELLSFLKNTSE